MAVEVTGRQAPLQVQQRMSQERVANDFLTRAGVEEQLDKYYRARSEVARTLSRHKEYVLYGKKVESHIVEAAFAIVLVMIITTLLVVNLYGA